MWLQDEFICHAIPSTYTIYYRLLVHSLVREMLLIPRSVISCYNKCSSKWTRHSISLGFLHVFSLSFSTMHVVSPFFACSGPRRFCSAPHLCFYPRCPHFCLPSNFSPFFSSPLFLAMAGAFKGQTLKLVTYELWTLYRRRLSKIPQNGKINKVNYWIPWNSRRVRFCWLVRGFFFKFTWEKSSSNIYDMWVYSWTKPGMHI